jgi:predicted permease
MDLHPDARMLVFTLALSVLAGLLSGIVPALQITRGDLADRLKATSGASFSLRGPLPPGGYAGGRPWGGRTHRALVVGQVAFGVVLVAIAGLFVRTVTKLHPSDFRGKPDHVLLFTMKPQRELYDPDRIRRLVADLIPRIEALPGVQSASLAENGPLGSRSDSVSVEAPGRHAVRADLDLVTPHFFETIGVSHVVGRDLTEDDRQGTPLVALVNEALARALFGSPDAVGRTIAMPRYRSGAREYVVVGVVPDVHYYDVHAAPRPAMFLAIQQDTPYMPTLHVRTSSADTASVAAAVRHEFDMLDRGFPVFNIKTLALRIDDSVSQERLVAGIAGAFGAVALLLAGVGLYGLLAFTVSRRTREIGVRVALGSSRRSVVWLVTADALVLVLSGAVAGMAFVAGIGSLLARFLFGVSPFDPATLGASLAAMLMIALVAAGLPAYRASRIDPFLALRCD